MEEGRLTLRTETQEIITLIPPIGEVKYIRMGPEIEERVTGEPETQKFTTKVQVKQKKGSWIRSLRNLVLVAVLFVIVVTIAFSIVYGKIFWKRHL